MMAEAHLTTPLLLYIDDHQGGDTAKLVAFAQHLGVKVRTFKTTEDFEVWAALNMDFLQRHNTGAPHNIRVITDAIHPAHRTDIDVDAGRRVARWLREKLGNIPVLVKTPHNYIEHTRFVKDMWLVGSTCSYDVARNYIEQLAGVQEHNCSVDWARYNAH